MVCNDTNPSLDRCLWAKYDLKYCCNCLKYYFSTIFLKQKERKKMLIGALQWFVMIPIHLLTDVYEQNLI